MLNALARRKGLARVSATPGRTRALQFFDVAYRPTPAARPRALRFCDLPGYGYAKVSKDERDRWAAMIEDYLRERDVLRAVVLIVDARHAPSESDEDALALPARRPGAAWSWRPRRWTSSRRRGAAAALRAVERALGARARRGGAVLGGRGHRHRRAVEPPRPAGGGGAVTSGRAGPGARPPPGEGRAQETRPALGVAERLAPVPAARRHQCPEAGGGMAVSEPID